MEFMSRRNAVGSNFLNFVNVYEKVVWKMKILKRSFNRREFFFFFRDDEGDVGRIYLDCLYL